MKQTSLIIVCLISSLIFACRKEKFITGGNALISLSADTLRFDTVFASVGSITQYFTIRNDNNQKLLISNVTLKGGTASPFKINADGQVGPEVKDIELEANDSMYVFVSVSLNSNNNTLPFIVQDSVEIGFNGSKRFVQLESWGQNANFIRGRAITGNVTWKNNLPYVILAGLHIEANATLTIEKGCRIYLHADAPIIVDGTLKVNGDKHDSSRVYFRSDRLDEPYRNYPAGWPGIYFRGPSKNNELNYAVIQNAYQAIVAEKPSVNSLPKVSLNQCIIDNAYDAGVLGVQSSIQAVNCLISNCGKNIQLIYGGNHRFVHNTITSYSSSYMLHKNPLLVITNSVKEGNVTATADTKAGFQNCIFWAENGVMDNEVLIDKQGNNVFAVSFENCIWKVKSVPANVVATNMINNQAPAFDSVDTGKHYYDFRLKNNSPAINKGIQAGVLTDLDGNTRMTGLPDLGAYEKQ